MREVHVCMYFNGYMKHLHTCRHGGTYKVLKNLLKHKLLHHDSSKCEFAALDIALYVLHGTKHSSFLLRYPVLLYLLMCI